MTLLVTIAMNNFKGRVRTADKVGAMRVSKEKAAENRERMLTEAARLFRLAAGDCPRTYIEMEGAQAELAGIAAEH